MSHNLISYYIYEVLCAAVWSLGYCLSTAIFKPFKCSNVKKDAQSPLLVLDFKNSQIRFLTMCCALSVLFSNISCLKRL